MTDYFVPDSTYETGDARLDRRATCMCGHRYKDHSEGRACLAASTDPEQVTGADMCLCRRWDPLHRRVVWRLR